VREEVFEERMISRGVPPEAIAALQPSLRHWLGAFHDPCGNVREVVEIIRQSQDPEAAAALLVAEIGLTPKQAEAVLRMRLSQLTRLERQKIEEELADLRKRIAEYEAILADPQRLDSVIREELSAIAEKYGDDRRTTILERDHLEALPAEVPARPVLVGVTQRGYVNVVEQDAFRSQGRGGKGVIGIRPKEGDSLSQILSASTQHDLLVFTERGRVFKLPLQRLEVGERDSAGKNLRQFLDMAPDEEVCAVCAVSGYGQGYVLLATAQGIVNRNALSDYANAHTKGITAHAIPEGDRLVDVTITEGGGEVLLVTENGQLIRFPEEEVRVTKRPSKGVLGIRLDPGDRVVAMLWLPQEPVGQKLLLVTSRGYGKRVELGDIPLQGRAGKGVIGIKLDEDLGQVVDAAFVADDDEVVLSTAGGKVIRFEAAQVSTFSRYAQGVRLILVEEGDQVVSAVPLRGGEDGRTG
ncbi:MAG: DNA gyrase C-terminal beta-propeller domain-containing protein, partial [Candidatus Bipolaricaulaceae bacterium]